MENTTEIFDIEDADIDCDPSSDESKLITFLEERGLSSPIISLSENLALKNYHPAYSRILVQYCLKNPLPNQYYLKNPLPNQYYLNKPLPKLPIFKQQPLRFYTPSVFLTSP
ncbi:hypothetical protein ACLKA6_008511 [Drosophila palustris]